MGVTSLGARDLALGAALVALEALVTIALRLGVARSIAWSAGETGGAGSSS